MDIHHVCLFQPYFLTFMCKTLCQVAWGMLLVMMASSPLRAQHVTDRPSDNLLVREDLQALVDLQVERDAKALIAYLSHTDPAVRARAAFALASVQDSTAVPTLLTLLEDADATVQADAAFALGQAPGRVYAPALINALAMSEDTTVQRHLIEALGKKGDKASLVPLVSWAWKDTVHVAEIGLALGRYGIRDLHAPEAVDYLIQTLLAPDPDQRLHAAYYFGRSQDTTAWAPMADTVRVILDSLSLEDPAAMHLILGLSRLNNPVDTPRLLHWMSMAEDWRTRANAVRALRTRTDEQGIRAALYDRLVDPSVHVAVAAAQALNDGKEWSEKDVEIIQQWTQYNAYAWRITAPLLEGMVRQGENTFVLGELDRRRNSRTPMAYVRALPALTMLPGHEALERLVNAAHSPNTRVAYAALSILARRWQNYDGAHNNLSTYFDIFAYGLRQKDQALSSVSARALSDSLVRSQGSTALLQEVYEQCKPSEDLDVMTAILAALGASGDPDAEAFLRRELTYPHVAVLKAAGHALEQLTGETPDLPTGPEPPERTIDWAYVQALGPHPQLVLETAKGPITLVLDAEQAPLTTQTLAQFARAGQFDDVPFHRVIPNFVIQGGDFARRDGFGGPPFRIRSEFTRIRYGRGTIGMASSGKDTEGSQYFITHSMQPHLDGRYTAFGSVHEGLEVVDTIYEDDHVVKATIIPDN